MLKTVTPVTLKNILVATDFSPLWEIAMPFVSAVAKRHEANLTFLHVIPTMIYPEIPLEPCPAEEQKQVDEAQARLGSVLETVAVPEAKKSTMVVIGDTVQAVLDAVAKHHIDLVVVTTHGHGGLARLVFGSTAEQILRRMPCPVLSIGPNANRTLSLESINTILVPVDFSEESKRAATFAVGLAQEYKAKIVLLHVIDRMLPVYQIESSMIFANREIENIDTDDVSTQRIVRVGTVEQEIIEAITEFGAPCIVMGRHEHGAVSTHLPMTTLHTLLTHSPCPIFTVA